MDIRKEAITVYKADVSDHVSKLKNLSVAEKEHADTAVSANKAISQSFADLAGAMNIASKAFSFAKESFDEYARHTRLASASAGVDIERLREASRGLKTEMDLLSDAARFNHAQFKLTTEQMEIAEKAMVALKRHGYEAAEAHDAIMHAVVGLRTRGLEQLGIWIDKTGESMNTATGRGEVFGRIMQELTKLSEEVGDSQRTAGERVAAAGVAMADSWARVKERFGELTLAAAPFADALSHILEKATRIVDLVNNAGKKGARGVDWAVQHAQHPGGARAQEGIDQSAFETDDEMYARRAKEGGRVATDVTTGLPVWVPYTAEQMGVGRISDAQQRNIDIFMRGGTRDDLPTLETAEGFLSYVKGLFTDPWYRPPGRTGPGATPTRREDIWDDSILTQIRELAAPIIAEVMHQNDIINAHETGSVGDLTNLKQMGESFEAEFKYADKSLRSLHEILTREERYAEFQGRQSASALEKIFGPVGEFDLYKHAFEGLTGAVGNSMKAWIEGSESAGRAFKSFIGQAVEGLAVQMAIEALKFGAYAIGSLVPGPFFNPAAAAGYATTAAEFAAGAAIAAVAARELGHGGKDYSKGAKSGSHGAGSAAPTGGSGGWGAGGSHVVYVIGDQYGDQTSRQRANNFKRQARAAIGDAMGRNS